MSRGALFLFPAFRRFFFVCVCDQTAVDKVIDRMDEYYLSKDDWDSLVELGLDQYKNDVVLKKISPATKTHFTKRLRFFVPN
jgi:hypothetical protein